jgi:hypothetical protein
MKRLEIITLRTSNPHEPEAVECMKKFCEMVRGNSLSKADFYIHDSFPGDMAIVISSQIQEEKMKETILGNYMTEVLKQFGLVDYNCWLLAEEKAGKLQIQTNNEEDGSGK